MEKPNTQTQATLQVLKNFRQQQRNPDTQSVFSLLEAQLETVPEPEKLQILNMLESLGKSAAEDLRCLNFKNVRDESDELGISGCPLKPQIESPVSSSKSQARFKVYSQLWT
ncbi:hypothetical protein EGW08_015556 [Elysia chlorotica]|uniref:Uncharacterized protein n=1 Tax=Elysia chlorotica TaxID=188477 RepID=A0A433T567_ELYCH|nr:hypothetical protein EGW08_015556 [Elysia chlorotica]